MTILICSANVDISLCFQNREKNLKNNDTEPVSSFIHISTHVCNNGSLKY